MGSDNEEDVGGNDRGDEDEDEKMNVGVNIPGHWPYVRPQWEHQW